MEDLRADLKGLIVESLRLETPPQDIDDEAPLFGDGGLGLDSLDVLELAVALEYRYGFQLELDAEQGRRVFTNIASLAAFVEQKRTK